MRLSRWFNRYRKVVIALLGVGAIGGGTLIALRWARGYRPSLGEAGPVLAGTGLLVADSDPEGAYVFVNGKLTTATDDTLNLPPGIYELEIKKDGFIPWKKTLKIQTELVTQTNTKLFPSVSNLTPLTFTGAREPVPSPDGQKIVYRVDSASNEPQNGLWVLALTDRNLPIARASEPRQIVRNVSQYDFLHANLVWSPDSSQVLAYWEEEAVVAQAVLLDVGSFNDAGDFKDATTRLPVLLSQWHHELDLKEQERLAELPEPMQRVATESATAVYFSPDEQRLLYTATEELTIPEELIPDLPSESTQTEDRDLERGSMYVYDIKEDRNYGLALADKSPPARGGESRRSTDLGAKDSESLTVSDSYWPARLVGEASASSMLSKANVPLPPVPTEMELQMLELLRVRYSPIFVQPVQWFPTSAHLVSVNDGNINIMEYDGQNNVTVYAGPLASDFVYPWPNGSRLVVLTNLNDPNAPANLYGINLK